MSELFDLSKLTVAEQADEGAWLQPRVGGQLLPFRWRIVGRHSATWHEIDKQVRNDRFKQLKKDQVVDMDADKMDDRQIRLLAKASRGWQTLNNKGEWVDGLFFEGHLLPFSTKNAQQVLRHPKFTTWLPDKLDLFIADEANFFANVESLPKAPLNDEMELLGEVEGNLSAAPSGNSVAAESNG